MLAGSQIFAVYIKGSAFNYQIALITRRSLLHTTISDYTEIKDNFQVCFPALPDSLLRGT